MSSSQAGHLTGGGDRSMVAIAASEDGLKLMAPFHPGLSAHTKALRGRWHPGEACWTFARDQEEALRARCLQLWGVDGRPETYTDLVTAEITAAETDLRLPLWSAMETGIWLLGREVVGLVKGRRVARPGRGCRFLKGAPVLEVRSSLRWISVPDGTVVRIEDVPRMALPHMEAVLQGHGSITVAG